MLSSTCSGDVFRLTLVFVCAEGPAARVVRRDIRDHVVQIDGLIHLEAAVQNYVGELDGAQNYADRIALTIQTQHTANGAARRKDNLAHLEIADLRRIGVKGPGQAIRWRRT